MRPIKKSEDQQRALKIMIKCFGHMPGMIWMLKGKGNKPKHTEDLMRFILNQAMMLEGAFISENSNGIIFLYHSNLSYKSRVSIFQKLKLCFIAMGIRNTYRTLMIQNQIGKLRPKDGLYVWILASDPDENGHKSGFEIKNWLMDLAKDSGLPIYVETTDSRNKRLYEHLGFIEYSTVENPYAGITVSLMKKEIIN